ncbi:sugar transferase [Agromyces seonyuensis]|uniref:Exopolysaccharide biosynthesis polyprenyl glycosylphosphotransferase n=1 Tax=Agromyces seonyuensis TaxID=2662446 RepID=A0A6I4NUA4_9MICO|nr:sugar transferase [Agromyces seonyuensis]MWB97860.1 exopolysaccharide biosynthesis polyprenyl glycosylphosphotransferase [Agromyces seonyuensis]
MSTAESLAGAPSMVAPLVAAPPFVAAPPRSAAAPVAEPAVEAPLAPVIPFDQPARSGRAGGHGRHAVSALQRTRRGYRVRTALTDFVAIVGAVAAGILVELAFGAATTPLSIEVGALLVVVSMSALAVDGVRQGRRGTQAGDAAEYRGAALALGLAFGITAFVVVLTPADPPRLLVGVSATLAIGGVLTGRLAWASWFRRTHAGAVRAGALLVGDRADVLATAGRLLADHGAFRVLGAVLDDGDDRAGLRVDGLTVPVVCGSSGLVSAARSIGADTVLAVGGARLADARSLAWQLEGSGLRFALVGGVDGIAPHRIRMRPLGGPEGLDLLHVDVAEHRGALHVVKRTLDLMAASVLLLLAAPVLVAVAMFVAADGGPVLYRQHRIGRDGRGFDMLKFRSMVPDAHLRKHELVERNDAAGLLFKVKDDPRVTRVGKFLRRHSLDELPQLWNVVRGDMSLVGPRPPLPDEAVHYSDRDRRRLLVRPGMTGLWQVSGRSDLGWDESIALDLYYVENWTLRYDLGLLLRTVRVVVDADGAY